MGSISLVDYICVYSSLVIDLRALFGKRIGESHINIINGKDTRLCNLLELFSLGGKIKKKYDSREFT